MTLTIPHASLKTKSKRKIKPRS